MSTDLHVTTSQNYANTQDRAEGLRNKLREIEGAKARVLNEANMAEANRAHHLARVGGVHNHPSYVEAMPGYDAQKKLYESKLEDLRAQHATIKEELDHLEGNPTENSTARSNAEQANKNAINLVQSVSEGKPLDIQDELDRPAVTEYVDDPNKSFGTIQAALMTAASKDIERVVRQNIEAHFDREEAADKFQQVAYKAVDKARSAPAFGEVQKNEVVKTTESYVMPPAKDPIKMAGPEPVDVFEGQIPLEGTTNQSVSGLTVDVEAAKKAEEEAAAKAVEDAKEDKKAAKKAAKGEK